MEVEGRDLGLLEDQALTEYRAERVGFVWQGTARNLVPYLSVRDNIRLPATVRRTQVAKKHDVDGLLELVGLNDRAKHKPGMLSGGEQQRVAIAAALSEHARPSCWPTSRPRSWTPSPPVACWTRSARSTASSTSRSSWSRTTWSPPGARTAGSGCATAASCTRACRSTPSPSDGRVRLPDEAVAALGGVDLEAEVTPDEVRLRRRSETGHA